MVAAIAGPTPEEYAAKVGGDAKIVPAGELAIDGRKVDLRQAADGAGQQARRLRRRLSGFPDPQSQAAGPGFDARKLWIHAHECGHQYRGPDEETADCFAVQRGRRQGWLTAEGLEEVCKFISPAKGDSMHFSGSNRCEAMRKCYADPTVK